jgi:hypothetical protein
MRLGSKLVAALLASFGLLACSSSRAHRDVNAPEADPWSDYKGTFAPGGPQDVQPSETKPKSIASAASVAPEPAAAPAADEKPAKGGRKPKKGSKPAKAAVAAAEPEPSAAPPSTTTTTTAADTKPPADDAKSMYGIESSAPAPSTSDGEDAAAPAKKAPKKRAAGKKAGKKPAKK